MLEQRIKELEEQLHAAQTNLAELTKANVSLKSSLADAELSLKRARRSARRDGIAMQTEISSLQNRRS